MGNTELVASDHLGVIDAECIEGVFGWWLDTRRDYVV
jgi:hypothetical protein